MSYPTLAPNSTWFSQGGTTIERASITQINIVDSYTPTGNETASWDASAAKDGSVMVYVTGTVLTIAGNGSGKIMANADSSWAFSYSTASSAFINATAIDGLALLDTSNVTSMYGMFRYLPKVTTLDVGSWDTSNVESMYTMFAGSSTYPMGLTSLNVSNWDVSKVTDMSAMFQLCPSLITLDVSDWDVSNVTSMHNMFNKCESLETLNVSSWDVSKVTSMRTVFANCTNLTELDVSKWDTGSVTTMRLTFNKCESLTSLDISNWDVSKVTDMSTMFQLCSSLTELDVSKWNPESCTDMSFMFYGLNGLTQPLDVSNWDVSKVTNFDHMMAYSYAILNGVENWAPSSACTNMNAMFHSVQNTSLDVSKFDTSNVQFFAQMFQSANKLTKIIGLENFNTANGLGFEEMFQYCSALIELDLSSFDTRKAKDGVLGSENGHLTATMQNMFQDNFKLKKISLGVNFSFKGDGTTTNTANYAVLPTPSADYIYGADGNWYTQKRVAYTPASIPDNTTETYYASVDLVNNIDFLIKNGTLIDVADQIRTVTGTNDAMTPAYMQSNLEAFNTDMAAVIAEQDDLITQIMTALESKLG